MLNNEPELIGVRAKTHSCWSGLVNGRLARRGDNRLIAICRSVASAIRLL